MKEILKVLKELQKEISIKLNEINKLSKDNIEIYDKVKENAVLPFIKLGDVEFSKDKTKTTERIIIVQEIQTWSSYQGKKETIDLLDKILNKISELEGKDFKVEENNKNIFNIGLNDGGIVEIQEFYRGYLKLEFKID